jgi:protein-S-isoprenylcysteine O-methyltransferase Ste14
VVLRLKFSGAHMEEIGYVIGFNVATACAFGRVAGIAVGSLRSLVTRRRFEVVPAYLLYIRSEEAMMIESFGDEYRRYRDTVPMLVPRRRAPCP